MIQAFVTVVAQPGQRDGMLQALRSLVNPTRVEPGCLSCRLHEDADKLGAFVLEEEWASRDHFERRLRSEPYRHLLHLMELSAEPPEVRFQVVSDTMGMEAIHAARAP